METNEQRIAERLVSFTRQVREAELFPALTPQATSLVRENPYAFCLGTCLDRGTRAEVIWTIPYWMQQILGHLDPLRIRQMDLAALANLVEQLPKKPRYATAAPRTISDITLIVVDRFGGDAAAIWKSQEAAVVQSVFRSVYGVGPGIASMAVLLLERGYGITFSDLDHPHMDIKPDVHTVRVLYRLGVSPTADVYSAIATARQLNPPYPGELDSALWRIGRTWCNAFAPLCGSCPMNGLCAHRSPKGASQWM